MHLLMITTSGGVCGGEGGGRNTPRNSKFGCNSLPMSHKCVSKIPWTCIKIYTEFLLEFQSKVSKVPSLFQSVLTKSKGK